MAAPVRLQTHVWNPAGDRRALLLHGLCSDGACWWRLASELADDGWLVLAPDLRGHGRSPPGAVHDLPTLAGDVAALGDGWDLLVGHSVGGTIAAQLLTQPEAADVALLIDPVLQLTAERAEQLRVALRAEAGGTDPVAVAADNPTWDERDVWRKVLATRQVTPDVVDAVLAGLEGVDLTLLARRWQGRVHLLAADPTRGGLLDASLAASLCDGERITWELVTGAGHSLHRERPDVVREAARGLTAPGGNDP
ncbi:MAG: alpha/beta fold hydrolase [Nitriliruptoraceae bacterium]